MTSSSSSQSKKNIPSSTIEIDRQHFPTALGIEQKQQQQQQQQ
jgi:hypothetical protein